MNRVTFTHAYWPHESSAEVDFSGFQWFTPLMERIRKPCNRICGMVKYASATPGLDHFTVSQAERRNSSEIDVVGLKRAPADQKPGVRCIVGDGVDHGALAFGIGVDRMNSGI